jgi:predicted enzyme related to lactoylglutathione lyase
MGSRQEVSRLLCHQLDRYLGAIESVGCCEPNYRIRRIVLRHQPTLHFRNHAGTDVFWLVEKYHIQIGVVMSQVQVEQKSYQMPPPDGFTVAHFLTVADIERSARFYERVFGGRILSRGDSSGAPGYIQIANTWLIVNVGGGPTPDKPSVTLSVPAEPDSVSSFMNIRVADIQACYELWRNRGAEFLTEPKDKYGETRCYIRDPDGYIIEVGQSKPGFAYG